MSKNLVKINDFFKENENNKLVLALSGGVDSSVLLFLAKQNNADVKPYFVKSAFVPEFEFKDALDVCNSLGIPLEVITVDILADKTIASNPPDRCYYCKKKIFSEIIKRASNDGYRTVIDGTNATDDISDRPGYKALGEYKVLSPFKLCGIGKKEIRQVAEENNIKVWNKPSYSCLATRIPCNCKITDLALKITETAECELMKMGFSDFRIRYKNGDALLQLTKNDMALFSEKEESVRLTLNRYYNNVFLDANVRESNG